MRRNESSWTPTAIACVALSCAALEGITKYGSLLECSMARLEFAVRAVFSPSSPRPLDPRSRNELVQAEGQSRRSADRDDWRFCGKSHHFRGLSDTADACELVRVVVCPKSIANSRRPAHERVISELPHQEVGNVCPRNVRVPTRS